MKLTALHLDGLVLIESPVHRDDRGFLVERFRSDRFADFGLPTVFAHELHTRSLPRVLRGLHFQEPRGQGKRVSVARGRIWDVAVDIRRNSPTFGDHFSIELNDENGLALWIPAGFAHGYCVLGNTPADVDYKMDVPYCPEAKGGIHSADPALAISWPIEQPILSNHDATLPPFEQMKI